MAPTTPSTMDEDSQKSMRTNVRLSLLCSTKPRASENPWFFKAGPAELTKGQQFENRQTFSNCKKHDARDRFPPFWHVILALKNPSWTSIFTLDVDLFPLKNIDLGIKTP